MLLFHLVGSETFLAASMHALPSSAATLPTSLWEIQRRATRVLFETDLDRLPAMPQIALLNAQTPLSSIIPIPTFRAATSLWSRFDVQLSLETLKPWFAGLVLANSLGESVAFERTLGVDHQIWQATPVERRFVLEGTEAFAAFDSAPLAEQIAYLDLIARTPDVITDRLHRFCRYWQGNNVGGFEEELARAKQQFPAMFSGLIDGRNRAWLQTIIDVAQQRAPSLVLVGALHLVGRSGLPALLSQHGFKVSAS